MTKPQDQVPDAPTLRIAGPDDAVVVACIISEAFHARPVLDPPADALSDTLASTQRRIAEQIGVIARDSSGDIGCLFLSLDADAIPPTGTLHRVSVVPRRRLSGVAAMMVNAAAGLAVEAGMRRLQLVARRELPSVIEWWATYGFEVVEELDGHRLLLSTALPARLEVATPEAMRAVGIRLAGLLSPGDLVVLSGELGAGKTTLAQGIGEGLAVQGPITSPTFVISRVHAPVAEGPQLVHVDAYRLGSAAELEDLDLDASLAESVTLVEWGAGLVEGLAGDRLEIEIHRTAEVGDETRILTLHGVGQRWRPVDLWEFADQQEES